MDSQSKGRNQRCYVKEIKGKTGCKGIRSKGMSEFQWRTLSSSSSFLSLLGKHPCFPILSTILTSHTEQEILTSSSAVVWNHLLRWISKSHNLKQYSEKEIFSWTNIRNRSIHEREKRKDERKQSLLNDYSFISS